MLKKVFVYILLYSLVCVLSDEGSEKGGPFTDRTESVNKKEGVDGREGGQGDTEMTTKWYVVSEGNKREEIVWVENRTEAIINLNNNNKLGENKTKEPTKHELKRIERANEVDVTEQENETNKMEEMWQEWKSKKDESKENWEWKISNKTDEEKDTTNTSFVEDKLEIVGNTKMEKKIATVGKPNEEEGGNKTKKDDKNQKQEEETTEHKMELTEEEIEAQKVADRLELEEKEARRLEEIKEQKNRDIKKSEEMDSIEGKREVKAIEQTIEMKNNTKNIYKKEESKLKNNNTKEYDKYLKEENQTGVNEEKLIEFIEEQLREENSTLHEKDIAGDRGKKFEDLNQETPINQETEAIEEKQKRNIIKVKKVNAGNEEKQVVHNNEFSSDGEVSTQKMSEEEEIEKKGEEEENEMKNNETNALQSLEEKKKDEVQYIWKIHEESEERENITKQDTSLSDEDNEEEDAIPEMGDVIGYKPTRSARKPKEVIVEVDFEVEPELNVTDSKLEPERRLRDEDAPVFRVVSGTPVQPGDVPYQIAFRCRALRAGEGMYRTFCGGALMSTRRIVSAAHCFRKYTAEICKDTLRAGRVHRMIHNNTLQPLYAVAGSVHNTEMFGDNSTASGQWRRLQSISYPSSYLFPQDDICVVETMEPFMLDGQVQPVRLARRHVEYHGLDCLASGYGRTSQDNQNKSEVLLRAPMSVEVRGVCERLHGRRMRDQLCTVTHIADVAKGDSGGPLVCHGTPEDLMEGRPVLVGIVSGKGRTRRGSSSFFTRVSSYREFLEADPAPFVPEDLDDDATRTHSAIIVLCLLSILHGLLT